MKSDSPMTDPDTTSSQRATPPAVPIPEVEVTALEKEHDAPVIPADRRISFLGWLAALAIFIVNKKLGLVLVIVLLVFQKFPAINMKSLARKTGKLFKKARNS